MEMLRVNVWQYTLQIQHYRLPVWDGLVELGKGQYNLKIWGQTVDGHAFGGGSRNYCHHTEIQDRKIRGQVWHGAIQDIKQQKPDIVIISAPPRLACTWQIPRLVRSYGGVSIAWTKSHSYSGLPTIATNYMKQRLYKRFDYFIAYGEETKREMMGLGVEEGQIVVAQNTIDTRRIFQDKQTYQDRSVELRKQEGLEGKKILLDLGRMDPAKRHTDIIRAWPRIRKIDPELVLILVGGGPNLEEYRALAKQTDSERIKVMGRVPIGDDYAWIAAADMTIQCGAVGLAINQSMAFGVPTIIADQKGVDTELIVEGKTGWRFHEGDIDDIFRAIKQVYENPQERQRITGIAMAKIRDEANIVNMYNQVDRCIHLAMTLRNKRKKKG